MSERPDRAQRLAEKLCEDFFELDADDRGFWLRSRTEQERNALWQALVHHQDLQAQMVVDLPQPYQAELCRFLCGDPQRGINSSGRVFFVEPTGEPVEWQIGTFANRKQMRRIDKKTALPADQAICFLWNLGPNAAIELNRGKIREWTESKAEPPKAEQEKGESKKK